MKKLAMTAEAVKASMGKVIRRRGGLKKLP
jgi:hypothetical protein